MRQDKVFDAGYSDIYHTGSFYTGTKIVDTREFDINVVLKLPIDENEYI